MPTPRATAATLTVLITVVLLSAGSTAATPTTTLQADDRMTCEYPVTLTDATGTEITLDAPPERIVGLAPSDAQLLWEIGAQDKAVGIPVGQYTDYLDGHDEPTDISGADDLTVIPEEVVALEPDLVLAANVTPHDTIQQFRGAGLTVYHFGTAESIDDLYEKVNTAGVLADECDGAVETVEWMQTELEIIERAVDDADRPLAFYAMGDGWTAGTGTFQHELLVAAGVENLGAAAGITGWGVVSEELIVDLDPEWLIWDHNWAEPPLRTAEFETSAWESEQVVVVNAHYFNQPGPRVVIAIRDIVQAVHPEAYAVAAEELAAQPDPDTDPTDDETEVPTDDEIATTADDKAAEPTPQEEPPLPGFGVAVALLAVLLAVLAKDQKQR